MIEFHLVVFVHGLWGTIQHFRYIAKQLEQECGAVEWADPESEEIQARDGQEVMAVLRTRGNTGYSSIDGVDVCGCRVADEIQLEISRLTVDDKSRVTKFSISGYSFGGLIARYAVGLLEKRGVFDNGVKPMVFTSFCSPNVGVRVLGEKPKAKITNFIGSHSMGATSHQLFLVEETDENEQCILERMADPSGRFMRGLARFERLSLYSNIYNDTRCEWYTSFISTKTKYASEKGSVVAGPYLADYPVVLDYRAKPVFESSPTFLQKRGMPWYSGIYLVINLLSAILWFICFLVNCLLQNLGSSFRQYRFLNEGFKSEKQSLLSPLLEKMPQYKSTEDNEDNEEVVRFELDDRQKKIIKNLNTLPWEKHPLHIKNTTLSHACCIVRYPDVSFKEGEIVVKHWIDRMFKGLREMA